jgi:hypothetical protein
VPEIGEIDQAGTAVGEHRQGIAGALGTAGGGDLRAGLISVPASRRLLVDGGAQLLLQLDERRHRRIGGEAAGDLEDLPERLVALLLIERQSRGLLRAGTEAPVKRDGQELSVAERVADAVAGDRVAVIVDPPTVGQDEHYDQPEQDHEEHWACRR